MRIYKKIANPQNFILRAMVQAIRNVKSYAFGFNPDVGLRLK